MTEKTQGEVYFEIYRQNRFFGLLECYGIDKVRQARELSSSENFKGLFEMREITERKFRGLQAFANLFDKPIYLVE